MGRFSRTTGDRNVDEDINRLYERIQTLENSLSRLSPNTAAAVPVIQQITAPQRIFVGTNPSSAMSVNALIFDADAGFVIEEANGGADITFRVPILTADPVSTETGQFWVREDLSEWRVFDGVGQLAFQQTFFDFERLSGAGETLASSQANIYQRVIDDAATPQTLTLPDPTSHTRPILIRALSAPAGGHTVARNGAESIDGVAADLTLGTVAGQLQSVLLVSDGTDWYSLQRVLA